MRKKPRHLLMVRGYVCCSMARETSVHLVCKKKQDVRVGGRERGGVTYNLSSTACCSEIRTTIPS